MSEKRFYLIVPNTVDTPYKGTFVMEPGRLMAQCCHIGRKLQAGMTQYEEVTTIVLSVRNSKELRKVSDELASGFRTGWNTNYQEFHDTNPVLYGTDSEIHTVTGIGPISKEDIDFAIGHLELY
jgi:peptidyl-tRNA hydrolase